MFEWGDAFEGYRYWLNVYYCVKSKDEAYIYIPFEQKQKDILTKIEYHESEIKKLQEKLTEIRNEAQTLEIKHG